jgi:hypothetical protein
MHLSSSTSGSAAKIGTIPANLSENFNTRLFQQAAKTDSSFMAQQNMFSAYHPQGEASSSSQPAAAVSPLEVDLFNPPSRQQQPVTVIIYSLGKDPVQRTIHPYDPTRLSDIKISTNYTILTNLYNGISYSTKDIYQFLQSVLKENKNTMRKRGVNITSSTDLVKKNLPAIEYTIESKVSDKSLRDIYSNSTNTVRTLQAIDSRHFDLQMEAAKVILTFINSRNKSPSGSQDMVRKLEGNKKYLPYNKQAFLKTLEIMQKLQQDFGNEYETRLQNRANANQGDQKAAQTLQEFQSLRRRNGDYDVEEQDLSTSTFGSTYYDPIEPYAGYPPQHQKNTPHYDNDLP